MIIHILFLEMKGYVFCLVYTWYRGLVLSLPLKIISKQVSFLFFSLLFKKNVRNLTWYLFNTLLFFFFFAPSLFFYFELICELLLAAK